MFGTSLLNWGTCTLKTYILEVPRVTEWTGSCLRLTIDSKSGDRKGAMTKKKEGAVLYHSKQGDPV